MHAYVCSVYVCMHVHHCAHVRMCVGGCECALHVCGCACVHACTMHVYMCTFQRHRETIAATLEEANFAPEGEVSSE